MARQNKGLNRVLRKEKPQPVRPTTTTYDPKERGVDVSVAWSVLDKSSLKDEEKARRRA